MGRTTLAIVAASFALGSCGQEPAADGPAAPGNATAVAPSPAANASSDETRVAVAVARKDPFGAYLVDGRGLSLYMLEADARGAGDAAAVSRCSGECAREWPPLTASAAQASEQVDGALLSTIARSDGSMQVTYNGWPLYHYHDDAQPGDTKGQAVHDQWGGWYLLAPSGTPIGHDEG